MHIVGEGASELLHSDKLVFAFKGTVEYFADAVFNTRRWRMLQSRRPFNCLQTEVNGNHGQNPSAYS